MEWHAFHAWCHSIEAQERLAVHLFGGHKLDSDWFFIKYWVGGPHLRVRTRSQRVHEALLRKAQEWLDREEVPSLDRNEFYSRVNLFGEDIDDVDELPWFPSGTVLEMPYYPELDRYMGLNHITASERAFQHSSALAVAAFATPHSPSARVALGGLTLWGLAQAHDIATADFFQRYAEFWNHIAGKETDRILSPKSANTICSRIVSGQTRLARVDRCVSAMTGKLAPVIADITPTEATLLIASHMHMTNNRLSVLPAAEAALAYGFVRVLERDGL
ncbi:lantibiotic dehydratase C-terminal domain-containing protein [Arcanobacterium hippocoleae]